MNFKKFIEVNNEKSSVGKRVRSVSGEPYNGSFILKISDDAMCYVMRDRESKKFRWVSANNDGIIESRVIDKDDVEMYKIMIKK